MDKSVRTWVIKDKTLSNTTNSYKIPNTVNRLAIYERSSYLDNKSAYSFRSILEEDPDFDLDYYLNFKRSSSNIHRMASLVNCLVNQRSNLMAGLSVVECGAGPTQSSKYISRILQRMNFKGTYSVYDTFEGHVSSDYNSKLNFSIAYKKFVKDFSKYPFIKIVKGSVPESFNEYMPENICFLNLDMNLYEPTKSALEILWPKIHTSGVICIDDYNIKAWQGVTDAVDEFTTKLHHMSYFKYDLPLGGSFIIKK